MGSGPRNLCVVANGAESTDGKPTAVAFPTGAPARNLAVSSGLRARSLLNLLLMPTAAASEARRRAVHLALVGGPLAELAGGRALVSRSLWLLFQVATLVLLAVRGFPEVRLLVHAGLCLFYVLGAWPTRAAAATITTKLRMLTVGLLACGGWIANTGGIASPLMPIGLGLVAKALVILHGRRQKACFGGAALALLLALALLSRTSVGALVPPLAAPGGQVTPEYLLIAAGAVLTTAFLVSHSWARMIAAYDRVAVELGARREELCCESEQQTRELEGAAARLAHEIKNPLASIKCLSTHLARGTPDAKTAERLAVVSAEADRLEAIVDRFFDVSQGLGELDLAPTRPHTLANELLLLLESRANQARIALEVTGDVEVELHADAKKLRRVLFYLVVNALQASSPGQTVTIAIGAPTDDEVDIKIIDRGEGMTREVLERVKRPYFTTRVAGVGLGIAVARALIEQHGGRLGYDSVPGRGTTVTVALPRRAREHVGAKLSQAALRGGLPEPS
jgi:signal transduction histidine kinase